MNIRYRVELSQAECCELTAMLSKGKLAVTPEALPNMHDRVVERLGRAKYPVADVDVVEHGDDLLEIVATLVSTTAINPKDLDEVVTDLERQPDVRHATWEASTKD